MNVIDHINSSASLAAIIFIAFYCSMLAAAKTLQNLNIIKTSITRDDDRYGALDGLRGVLAYGVMTHHTITAYNYFETGHWQWSENATLNNLGQSTVAIFFMITAFLFTEKIINHKIDWKKLYISRIARLAPLHTVVVIILFILALSTTNFELRVTPHALLKQFLQWLTFACFGRPDINGIEDTWTMIAGVNWSLRYEWGYYIIGLPLLAFAAKKVGSSVITAGLALLIIGFTTLTIKSGPISGTPLYVIHFACGILAAFIFQSSPGKKIISSSPFKAIAVASLLTMGIFSNSGNAAVLLASMIFFLAVIGGLSFFGTLKSSAARWLGDISYGIYLIHGLILWIIFSSLKNHETITGLNSLNFLIALPAIGSIVMIAASLSYIYLEKPAIEIGRLTPKLAKII